jgi:hypothetical protein
MYLTYFLFLIKRIETQIWNCSYCNFLSDALILEQCILTLGEQTWVQSSGRRSQTMNFLKVPGVWDSSEKSHADRGECRPWETANWARERRRPSQASPTEIRVWCRKSVSYSKLSVRQKSRTVRWDVRKQNQIDGESLDLIDSDPNPLTDEELGLSARVESVSLSSIKMKKDCPLKRIGPLKSNTADVGWSLWLWLSPCYWRSLGCFHENLAWPRIAILRFPLRSFSSFESRSTAQHPMTSDSVLP